MNEIENKVKNMETAEAVDSDISLQATSKLISSKAVNIPKADLAAYFLDATGMTLESYFQGKGEDAITDAVLKAVGKAVKPKVYNLIKLLVDVAGICDAINTAMTVLELGKAIYNVYKRNGRQLRIVTNNYEWLSGSGNHSSYYSKVTYSTVL